MKFEDIKKFRKKLSEETKAIDLCNDKYLDELSKIYSLIHDFLNLNTRRRNLILMRVKEKEEE